jgi:hypothetical protein
LKFGVIPIGVTQLLTVRGVGHVDTINQLHCGVGSAPVASLVLHQTKITREKTKLSEGKSLPSCSSCQSHFGTTYVTTKDNKPQALCLFHLQALVKDSLNNLLGGAGSFRFTRGANLNGVRHVILDVQE